MNVHYRSHVKHQYYMHSKCMELLKIFHLQKKKVFRIKRLPLGGLESSIARSITVDVAFKNNWKLKAYLEHKNFASRFVNVEITFGWIFGINAGSGEEIYYIIWSIYISIVGCYLRKQKKCQKFSKNSN